MKQKDSKQYEVDEELLKKLEQPFQKKKIKKSKRFGKSSLEKTVERTYTVDEELQKKLNNPFEKIDSSFVRQLEEENDRNFQLTSPMLDELYQQVDDIFNAIFIIQSEDNLDEYKHYFTTLFFERFKKKLSVRKKKELNSSMIFEKRVVNYTKDDIREQVEVRIQLIYALEKKEKISFFNHEVANTITYKLILEKQGNWKLDKLKKVHDSKLTYKES